MPNTFKISYDGTNWFDNATEPPLKVKVGSAFKLSVEVTTEPKTRLLQLMLPVYGAPDAEHVVPKDRALMPYSTWLDVKSQLAQANVELETSDELVGVFTIRPEPDEESEGIPILPDKFLLHFTSNEPVNDVQSEAEIVLARIASQVVVKDDVMSMQTYAQVLTPVIRSFTADFYFALEGGLFPTLHWDIENCTHPPKITLRDNRGNQYQPQEEGFTPYQSYAPKASIPNGNIEYTLSVGNGGDSRTITLQRFGNTSFNVLENKPSEDKLMGLVTDGDGLYAFMLNPTHKSVVLWQSDNGAEWAPMSLGTRLVSFAAGLAIPGDGTTEPNNYVEVPYDFAGSPAVVMNGILYLIGGSRFDPQHNSNAVYRLSLKSGGFVRAQQDAGFAPRMGHAVVTDGETIYVLGGNDPDWGSMDEVWSYQPARNPAWKLETGMRLPQKRSFHSATIHDGKIYLFGGFQSAPGHADLPLDEALYCYDLGGPHKDKGWVKKELSTRKDVLSAFGIINLPAFKKANHAQVPSYCLSVYAYKDKYKVIQYRTLIWDWKSGSLASNLEDTKVAGLFFDNDAYYAIQSVAFKNVIWLSVVSVDADGDYKNSPLRYFVYAGN